MFLWKREGYLNKAKKREREREKEVVIARNMRLKDKKGFTWVKRE